MYNIISKLIAASMMILLMTSCTEKLTNNINNSKTSKNISSLKSNLDPATEKKIDELMTKMTLQEKVGQMNQYNGSWDVTGPQPDGANNKKKYERLTNGGVGSMLNVISAKGIREAQALALQSRLGIPLIIGYDVIHGYKTMFPIPLGETASWDMSVLERSARVAGTEASAAGINWTFAPMMDLGRDARWGRVMEGAGEDPFLAAKAAVARVRGFQGESLGETNTIAACAKHFAAYGFAEGGRDYNTVDMSRQRLHNIVLPPFKAVAEEGVATFMNAFNDLNGVPASGDKFLMRDLLKGEWDWDGFVVSDWGSIGEMVNHGYAADNKHAAELSAIAGSDMDMEANAYADHLSELVEAGKVDIKHIDDAVRRILRVKFDLGLFDDPYKYCDEDREAKVVMSQAHLDAARDVAKRSIVLMKNEGNLLPLDKSEQVAVIGPLANDKDSPLGSWRAQAVTNSAVSMLEGMQNVSGQASLPYAKGCDLAVNLRSFVKELTINQTDRSGFAEAVALAKTAKTVVVAMGEDCWQSGEGRSQQDIAMAGVQLDLLKELYAANNNIVLVLMNGRPLAIPWAAENIPAIVEAWHLGSEAGNAIADVLYGDYNPSGKLPITFPRSVGQVPISYNYKNTGRGAKAAEDMVFWSHYTDGENTPQFMFGHGLSYTTFSYSDVTLSAPEVTSTGSITASVTLSNTGNRDGEEVVQMYITDPVCSTTKPVLELKGFEKVMLKAGESKVINFEIKPAELLKYYGADHQWTVEAGEYIVRIGGNSYELQSKSFMLK